MVFFVIQVLTMIREASETEKAWDKMDEQIRHQRNHAATQSEHNVVAALQQRPWYSLLCSRFWSLTHESNRREEAVFRALRREFVLDRSLAEPFLPVAEDKQVEDSFNFGRYLGLAQIHILSHAVEVQKGTWVFFGVTATLFYGVAVVVHEKVEILGWIWVGIGWMVYLSNVVFAAHLVQLRNSFLPHSVLLSEHGSDEQTYFLESGGHAEHLPKWCTFDLQNFLEKRPILARLFVGGAPNRQQAHYWMDRDGPKFYLSILQVDLIFTGIYVGLLMLEFLPFAHHKESRLIFALYVVAAILPLFGILYNKRDLVALMAQVSSVGTYRKEQIIRDVLLQAKTARIVRTFIIVHRMRRVAAELGIPEVNEDMTGVHDLGSSSFSNLEIREVELSFLSFDTDNSGSISKDEFRGLLERLGAEIEEDKFDRLMNALDADGSGDVTKKEFVAWYEFYAEKDKISLKERAEDLFSMFDRNNSGEITLGEFKVRLDALNMGFTMDEIGAILHELDRDRSGSVSLEEFEDLLEKFYPEELREVE
jgi:Ca2+-binding EF-hand superfamily protein